MIGPVFWSLVLWLVAVQHEDPSQKRIASTSVAITAIGAVSAFIWTELDLRTGVFIPSSEFPWDPNFPWTYAAQLGLRAAIILGVIFLAYFLVLLFNSAGGKRVGGWWFPPIAALFAIEYFVYDDQFTLIALVILPIILAVFYRGIYSNKPEVKEESMLITYIRFSLMSLAIAEVLSTALWVAGIGTIQALAGTGLHYLASILPHAIIEIPAFLFAAAAALRIARDLAPSVRGQEWNVIPTKTLSLITDPRTWRTYILIIFFLIIAALIEGFVTPVVLDWVIAGMP